MSTALSYVQGISMLMSGLAKLDATIDGELLEVASASLQAGLPQYGHQAVANTFYSLARLQHYSAQLCAAVDNHVSENMSDFTPQVRLAVCNIPQLQCRSQSHFQGFQGTSIFRLHPCISQHADMTLKASCNREVTKRCSV